MRKIMTVLPLVLVLEMPLIAGLGLALAALHAHFKDVRDLLSSALTLLFFLTPVLYPISAVRVPAVWWVVKLSPATPFTLAYQRALFDGRFPEPVLWLEMALVALVGWAIGAWVYWGLFSYFLTTGEVQTWINPEPPCRSKS